MVTSLLIMTILINRVLLAQVFLVTNCPNNNNIIPFNIIIITPVNCKIMIMNNELLLEVVNEVFQKFRIALFTALTPCILHSP